jgi:hypothetical protein
VDVDTVIGGCDLMEGLTKELIVMSLEWPQRLERCNLNNMIILFVVHRHHIDTTHTVVYCLVQKINASVFN